jgi:hypothetical protein
VTAYEENDGREDDGLGDDGQGNRGQDPGQPPREPPFQLDGRLSSRFERRTVVIAPGGTRSYVEPEWRDAIVVVQCGLVELCGDGADRRRFGSGDILWLDGLPVRALHNPGAEPVVLVAVSRRPPGF